MIQIIKNKIYITILNEIEEVSDSSKLESIQIKPIEVSTSWEALVEACKAIVRESSGVFGLQIWDGSISIQGRLERPGKSDVYVYTLIRPKG